MKLIVVGAGDMATNIVDHFNLEDSILYYYDEPREKGEDRYGAPVKNYPPSPIKLPKIVSCIGDTRHKRRLLTELRGKMMETHYEPEYTNLIADGSYIGKTVLIGEGNIIQPMCNIYSRVFIGNHNLICGGTRIGHDTRIGDYCTLAPEVAIAGGVEVGDGVFLGINCTVIPRVKIGEGAVIGAGAVVVENVRANTIVVGNPARYKKAVEEPW